MLYNFLENGGQETYLSFWVAVEELRSTVKSHWHQIGAEIYYTFIHSQEAPIKVKNNLMIFYIFFLPQKKKKKN